MNNKKRQKRILKISDELLGKIEKSIEEIDRCVLKTKERTKETEYDSELKKPLGEIVRETENVEIVEGIIDRMGLKQLVSTLKDIKDIHLSFCEEAPQKQDEQNGLIVISDVDSSTLEDDSIINGLEE